MKNIFLILLFYGIYTTSVFAQDCNTLNGNLLQNPSFEEGNSGKPDALDQMHKCDYWEPINDRTPDWIDSRPGYLRLEGYNNGFQGPTLPASEGYRFVHAAGQELFQQKLEGSNLLEDGENYFISLKHMSLHGNKIYIPPTNSHPWGENTPGNCITCSQYTNLNETPMIKVYISKSKIANGGNPPMSNSSDRIEVLSYDLHPGIDPLEVWQEIQGTFVAPMVNADDYKWVGIQFFANNTNITTNENGSLNYYIYLGAFDEIVLKKGCLETCSKTDGPIEVTASNYIDQNNPFTIFHTSNVKSIRLEVFNSAGQVVIFDKTVHCENGIDFNPSWNGMSSPGNFIANGIYPYTLTVENDCGVRICSDKLLMLGGVATDAPMDNFGNSCFNAGIKIPEACCSLEPDYYIDNEVFDLNSSNWLDVQIVDNIYVSTAVPNSGDAVLVDPNSKLALKAGSQITLEPGFYAKGGSAFLAMIEDCGEPEGTGMIINQGGNQGSIYQSENNQIRKETLSLFDENARDLRLAEIKIAPNPSNGVFNISGLTDRYSKINVYDMFGSLVYTNSIAASIHRFSLSGLGGVYIVEVIRRDGLRETFRIIKN